MLTLALLLHFATAKIEAFQVTIQPSRCPHYALRLSRPADAARLLAWDEGLVSAEELEPLFADAFEHRKFVNACVGDHA